MRKGGSLSLTSGGEDDGDGVGVVEERMDWARGWVVVFERVKSRKERLER